MEELLRVVVGVEVEVCVKLMVVLCLVEVDLLLLCVYCIRTYFYLGYIYVLYWILLFFYKILHIHGVK